MSTYLYKGCNMTWTFFVLTCIIQIVLAKNPFLPETLPHAVKEHFQKKCVKNGHIEVFQDIENIFERFKSCSTGLIDESNLQETLRTAFASGFANGLDELSKTVCNVAKDVDKCFREMAEEMKPCLSAEEHKNYDILLKVDDNLFKYICYNHGSRITEFITEDGFKCFAENEAALMACDEDILDSRTQSTQQHTTMDDLFDLEITKEECNIYSRIQTCMANVIKTCNKPTLTTIVNSLFNVVRDATPCKSNEANSAITFAVTTLTVLMGLFAAILV